LLSEFERSVRKKMAAKEAVRRNRRVARRGQVDMNQAEPEELILAETAQQPRRKVPLLPNEALLRLPTPSRSFPREDTYEGAYQQVPPVPGTPSSHLGPEPWGFPDASMSPASNYRERLQARGQQAMQRSMYGGGSGMPGTPTSAHTPVNSKTSLLGTVPMPSPPQPQALQQAPSPVTSQWAQQPQQMPAFGVTGLDMSVMNQFSPGGLSPHTFSQASCTPQTFGSAGGCSSQVLDSSSCVPHGFSFPRSPQLPSGNGFGNQQQDLVAHLMPELLMMDRERLAEQLRLAAPTCYDD